MVYEDAHVVFMSCIYRISYWSTERSLRRSSSVEKQLSNDEDSFERQVSVY
ncbi:MAG: hypothetical protein AAGG07_06305 [Planctomycetota bacterium]